MKRVVLISFALLATFATNIYAADLCIGSAPNGVAVQQMTADDMFYKAQCFMLGQDGHPQDNGKAAEWFYQAAEKGHVEAQNIIAYLLAEGVGAKKDETKAIMWYTKAAENGHIRAQSQLGTIYANGLLGVTKSYTEAAKWFRMAAKNGDAKARKWLAKMADKLEEPVE